MEKDQLMAIIRDVAKEDVIPIVELLLEEGITMLEVSLSNETKGLACLEAVSQHFSAKQLTIGAGTVVEKNQIQKVKQAGATFIMTPGFEKKYCRRMHKTRHSCFSRSIFPRRNYGRNTIRHRNF